MLFPHIEGDGALIRHRLNDKTNGHLAIRPTHVVLAGNGAIVGGTEPLLRAIKDATGKQVTAKAAASACAVLAQSYKTLKLFALRDLGEIIDNVGSLDKYLADYYAFKSMLSQHYVEANKKDELSVRSSATVSAAIASVPPESIGLITTNWDSCLWASAQFENVIQLHGLAGKPESIVLPGEYSSDEDFAEVLEGNGFEVKDDEIRVQVQRMFRGDFRRPLNAALCTADSWLRSADTVIAWGLAFHPYDSEVCKLAWDVAHNTEEAKRLIVVNPSETDRQVCKFLFASASIDHVEVSA